MTTEQAARSGPHAVATTQRAVTVLLVDDHVVYRRGLEAIIGLTDQIDIVGQASDGEEAVRQCLALRPDVVLLDVRMPILSGPEACGRILAESPGTRVLMLTSSDEEADLFAAVRAGARGYLLKDGDPEEVADAIRRVHEGQSLIPPRMAAQLLGEFAKLSRQQARPPLAVLTGREQEVLRLIARGRRNREIAAELYISENTAKNHVRSILEKLQLGSRVEAAMWAVKQNLLEPDQS